jgi:hypothetical protein
MVAHLGNDPLPFNGQPLSAVDGREGHEHHRSHTSGSQYAKRQHQ